MDVELDVFEITFDPEGVVTIHSGSWKWITLRLEDFENIADIANSAVQAWEMLEQFWTGENWAGWEHLIDRPEPVSPVAVEGV